MMWREWRKYRILAIIMVISLLVGLSGAGRPIDQLLVTGRYWLDPIKASGDIMVVGIDKAAVEKIAPMPWDRRHYADMIDRLYAAGARRVVFDIDFYRQGTPEEDAAMKAALQNNPRESWALVLPGDHTRRERLASPIFEDNVQFASSRMRRFFNMVRYYDREIVNGRALPPLPVVLAGKENDTTLPDRVLIPYGVDASTIPYLSAGRLLAGEQTTGIDARRIHGKTVVVGLNYNVLGDNFTIIGQGNYGACFAAVMAAEGLKRGVPLSFGWLVPLLLAGLMAFGLSRVMRRRARAAGIAAGIMLLAALPTLVTYIPGTIEVVPALVGFSLLMTADSFHRLSKKALEDEIEGLGSMVLAEERDLGAAPAIICLIIANDAQIRAALSLEDQELVWRNLFRRVSFAIGEVPIYRQGNCLFWAEEDVIFSDIRDRLNGLHAVVRMPTWVGGDDVMVEGYFGIDMQAHLPLRARVAGAVAAVARGEGARVVLNSAVDRSEGLWALTVASEIAKGIERGDFWVAYQPQVDCRSGALVGAEALIRWQHPEKGFLDPAMFVAAAEKSGEIGIITDFVLRDVAVAMKQLSAINMPLQLSVNISPRQLDDASISEAVSGIFAAEGGDCALLTLELTETASLSKVHEAGRELFQLRCLGVSLSADDYGSGVSTLENLKASPVRELKIDKQFVQGMHEGNAEYHMVRSTVMMAHALGLRVVAEGVEDEATFELLQRLKCDHAQGYYIAKPMKLDDLISFARNNIKAA